jgi:2-iminobutanoate/2-iminopropanoate deaminase
MMGRWLLAGLVVVGLGGCAGERSLQHLPAPDALGPYSAAVLTDGLCLLSGKIGERGGSFAHEVETAFDAVERELDRAGLTLADVAAVTVYLTDMADYGELNAIYARRLPEPYPARTTVAVAALPGGARVELSVVARRH